jgi:hypothetical protein
VEWWPYATEHEEPPPGPVLAVSPVMVLVKSTDVSLALGH